MRTPTLAEVSAALRKKGYPVFDTRDFDLTMFGIRTNIGGPTGQSKQTDLFDDFIGAIWREHGQMQMVVGDATTDPGLHYLTKPTRTGGTAIVKPGHYPALWRKGPHGGQRIDAFRQNAPVTVYRDRDQDNYLDMGPGVPTASGVFWINLHPAMYRPGGARRAIGAWSAGCQVPAAWELFVRLRALRDEQIRRGHGTTFSYSLLVATDL